MSEPPASETDEMYDGESDLAQQNRLGDFLRACEVRLLPLYVQSDQKALAFQARYRSLIGAAAVFTTAALCLAAVNLQFHGLLPKGFSWAELLAAVGSAALVAFGLGGHWQKNWLLHRYQAERYRLLKFKLLAGSSLWSGESDPQWRKELDGETGTITALVHDDLDDEATSEEVPPVSAASGAAQRGDVSRLLEYYKRRRLTLQLAYFKRAARKNRSLWLDPLWVPGVFFVSMGLVLLNFLLERFHQLPEGGLVSRVLAISPILLPALLAGFRLHVTANEVARNRNRSLARECALQQIANRLGGLDETLLARVTGTVQEIPPDGLRISATAEGPPDSASVFANLALSEQILSTDQHEWLRLMLEAEWYR